MRALPILSLLAAFLLVKLSGSPSLAVEHQIVGNPILHEDWWNSVFDLTTVLGEIIVFIFYWFKFNEWAGAGEAPVGFHPRPARHFTTWLRYLGWNTLYGLLMVGSYSLIVFFPDLVSRLIDAFAGASINLNSQVHSVTVFQELLHTIFPQNGLGVHDPVQTATLAPYAVMLTTVVWAGMRPFSEFERRLRLRLQERAAIPTQARQLIEAFQKDENSFVPEKDIVVEVIKHMESHSLEVQDFSDSGESLWFLYARTRYLYHLLLKYNRSPVFSRLAERYIAEFKDLEESMSRLQGQIAQRIADIQELIFDEQRKEKSAQTDEQIGLEKKRMPKSTLKKSELWLTEFLERASKSQVSYFRKQQEELRVALDAASWDVVQLIVCGVLAVGRSLTHRRDLLEAFGLKEKDRISIQLDSVTLTWVAGGALLIVFLCSTVYFFAQSAINGVQLTELAKKLNNNHLNVIPKDMHTVLSWSVSACLMHLLAIAGGYVLQRSLETNRERLRIGKPRSLMPRAQMAEAIWSASFGFSLNIFLIGAFAAAAGRFQSLGTNWWWAAVPGVTAFFAALYTQKVDRSSHQLISLRFMQGAATGLMAILIFALLYTDALWGASGQQVPGKAKLCILIFGLYVGVTTTILGLALGKILHIWVTAERYAGQSDRRRDKRRSFLFKKAVWRTDSGELLVRAVSVSSSGAELMSPTPLEIESEGQVEIVGKNPRRARVLRNDSENSRHCYVQFLEESV